MDTIIFNKKSYPVRTCVINGGMYYVSCESLADELFTGNDKTEPVNDEAQSIDELIYFYVPDGMINDNIGKLNKFVKAETCKP